VDTDKGQSAIEGEEHAAPMPPRHWILVIVAFWLVMVGWLIHHDLAPRLREDEPAPFVVTLLDEPRVGLVRRGSRRAFETTWKVTKQGLPKEEGSAFTSIRYQQGGDALEFMGEFRLSAPDRMNPLVRLESSCRAGWKGELLGLTARLETRVGEDLEIAAELVSASKGLTLFPHWTVRNQPVHGDPVELARRGSVLIPTQPLNRIAGLRAGQRWRLPSFDLLAAADKSPRLTPRMVEARVSEEPLKWLVLGHVDCFVVDYDGDPVHTRTWLRRNDGLVLRQEFNYAGERIGIERDVER
jgi:hypothetical protein